MRNFFLLLVILLLLNACSKETAETIVPKEEPSEQVEITEEDRPLEASELEMTEWLLPKKNSRVRGASVTHVMLHFINDAQRSPEEPYTIENIYGLFMEYEVSAHYMIDREGKIYLLVPEERAAYHAGKGHLLNYQEYKYGLNDHSIGIELLAIGTQEEMNPTIPSEVYERIAPDDIGYTEAQYEALSQLLEDILKRNPGIKKDREHIIGHDEYAPVRKSDPGSLFEWSRIGL